MVGLERDLSGSGKLGLIASNEKVEPGVSIANARSYSRQSAYLRYSMLGARTTANIELGGNRLDGEVSDDSGAMVRIDIRRKIGNASTLKLAIRQDIDDVGNDLAFQATGQLPRATLQTGAASQTADPYTNEQAVVEWVIQGLRTRIAASAGISEESYAVNSQFNRDSRIVYLDASRQLGPKLSGRIGMHYSRYSSSSFAGKSREVDGEAAVNWIFSRQLSVDMSASRFWYSGDQFSTISPETRVWVRLVYGDRITRE